MHQFFKLRSKKIGLTLPRLNSELTMVERISATLRTAIQRQELIQRAYSLMRQKGLVSSPGYRIERRDPQPDPQSEITTIT